MDATVEVAMRLGVDPRKADQMVRGTVNLPHGTGKTARVIVFATGDKAAEAEAAGADVVGSDDLIERIQGGWLDFDAAIATPDQMAKVGRIARILGPRGLMPNPKTGTVTPDVTKAVNDIKGGKINFRVDKQANLHLVIGKACFDDEKLVENYAAALDEVLRAKPSAAKGRYLKKVTVSTTMGPGIPVDPNRTRNLLVDEPTPEHGRRRSAGAVPRCGPRGPAVGVLASRPRSPVPPETAGLLPSAGDEGPRRGATRAGGRGFDDAPGSARSPVPTPRAPCAGAFRRLRGLDRQRSRVHAERRRAWQPRRRPRPPRRWPPSPRSPRSSRRVGHGRHRVPRADRGAATQLRRSLGAGVSYAVAKNTLVKRAAADAGVEGLDDLLVGPTAIAFVEGEPGRRRQGAARLREGQQGAGRQGRLMEGRALSAAEVTQLADLESREVLLAKLAGAMKGNLTKAAGLFSAPAVAGRPPRRRRCRTSGPPESSAEHRGGRRGRRGRRRRRRRRPGLTPDPHTTVRRPAGR